jgi:hypothetical protein
MTSTLRLSYLSRLRKMGMEAVFMTDAKALSRVSETSGTRRISSEPTPPL